MLRSLVYKDNSFIGEAEIRPQNDKIGVWTREIRISHLSPPSDRCPPLAVLCTIAADGFCFKMETPPPPPPSPSDDSPLLSLYAACLREKKTAVVPLGNEELHLVAMPSRINPLQYACFWGFTVASGLYNSCLEMLNLRCLGIVFDLDETLVVANTMRSFEDRINNLLHKISNEVDQQRLAALLAEIKRYQEDKSILKQFVESDQVVENGKVFKVQTEDVPSLSQSHQQISRPVLRLLEKDIILTRVDPSIRDTSVLVRVRPAWEHLRSYLTARGRKRFEVYVCTMAERDYALEIWRLLDPESRLIKSNELLNRIVCVKAESKKSLLSVFQEGKCHPRMSLVIDDRLTVWDSKDKARVHVVPAFAPYYAPQAEVVSSVAVLCVARNVACNVRGGFFKEYDECLLQRATAAYYEDDIRDLPAAPDVSNYLIPEEDTFITNGNRDPLCFEGMSDVEVDRRLKETNCNSQTVPPVVDNFNHTQITSVHHMMPSFGVVPMPGPQVIMPYSNNPFPRAIVSINPVGQPNVSEHSLQGTTATEEGEVNESELDPDTRRRLLILQHGQDIRGTLPFQLGPPIEVTIPPAQSPPAQSPERWLLHEEKVKPRRLNEASREYSSRPETTHFVERRSNHSSFFCGEEDLNPMDGVNHRRKRLSTEVFKQSDTTRKNHSRSSSSTGNDLSWRSISTRNRDECLDSCQVTANFSKNPVEVLHWIAVESGAKVEYRTSLLNTIELQFCVEAWFVGEKIGEGTGKIRKEARKLAAEKAIHNLANQYLNYFPLPTTFRNRKIFRTEQSDFLSDSILHGCSTISRNDPLPYTSEGSRFADHRLEGFAKPSDSVANLKELCTMKGFSLAFNADLSTSATSDDKKEVHAQVEVEGMILGKGTGSTWNMAKLKAAEEAIGNLSSMLGQFTQKCMSSPRLPQTDPDRSWKTDGPQALQRLPSSDRFSKNVIPQS